MSVEVKQLELGRDAHLRREWLKVWEDVGKTVLKLPEWMQNIVLEDVNTAIKNRVATMEMIYSAHRKG